MNAREYPPATSEMKRLLTEQVVNPVLWEDCIRVMMDGRAEAYVEIGPGKVLAGLMKRIDRKAQTVNLSDLDGIRSFAESLA